MGLSVYDTVTFLPKISVVLGTTLFYALKGPFRGKEQSKNYGAYLTTKGANAFLGQMSVAQLQ